MIRGIYTATSSLITQENKQNVIVNNMANANTIGYKNDSLIIKSFDEVMLSNNDKSIGGLNTKQELGTISLGSEIDGVNTIFTQGTLKETNKNTDFSIEGRGFFAVNKNNETVYTRDGSFIVSVYGTLVTSDYGDVLGRNLATGEIEPIKITDNNFKLDFNNNIIQNGRMTHELVTADFDDYSTLTKIGDNYYIGENPIDNARVYVNQGSVESSNVNLIEEMTNMMTTMRNFETNQKILQMLDNTLSKASSQIGNIR